MKIGMLNIPNWALYTAAAGVALYIIKKGSLKAAAADAVAAVVGTAGNVATGAASGVVLGIGDVAGVPRTDLAKCKACIQAGDNYGASKYCSLGVFSTWQALSLKKKLFGTDFTMDDIFK